MTDKGAMAMALEALTYKKWWRVGLGEPKDPKLEAAITALRERLAQPEQEKALQALHNENKRLGLYEDAYAEQEPVAYPDGDVVGPCICGSWPGGKCLKCPRITPPQRTEPAQQKKVWTFWDLSGGDIADAIKAKLKEKNQ
jgi:hypothetical protein